MRSPLAIVCFLVALAGAAASWDFSAPPSALYRVPVHGDWRAYGTFEVDVTLAPVPGAPDLLLSVFVETKQDWWFESRNPVRLTPGRTTTLSLRLDDRSPDWTAPTLARPWGADVLRRVRCWGVKVYAPDPVAGNLTIGDPRLTLGTAVPKIVTTAVAPRGAVGCRHPVRFSTLDFTGNPYATADAELDVVASSPGQGTQRVAAYFQQRYRRLERPYREPAWVPFERPSWQANWIPTAAGSWSLRLVGHLGDTVVDLDLGAVDILPAASEPEPSEEPPTDSPFLVRCEPETLFTRTTAGWVFAEGTDATRCWWAPLDWTTRWGHYTGLGDLEQLTAQQFEDALLAANGKQRHPLLLVGEDELDDDNTHNWIDHPLNAANGGPAATPVDVFANPAARQVLRDRARYLLARYGDDDSIAGLAILMKRPGDAYANGVASLAAALPDVPIHADQPELPGRAWTRDVATTWRTDYRIAPRTALDRWRTPPVLTGRFPAKGAVVSQLVEHWADARVLAVDLEVPASIRPELKVAAFLRLGTGSVFHSRLQWLQPGANRVFFHLDRPNDWQDVSAPESPLAAYDLLNVREIGLQFYYDYEQEIAIQLLATRLHGPWRIERPTPLRIEPARCLTAEPRQYERFELAFDLNRVFHNPYDPAEVTVDGTIRGPRGPERRQPAYFHRPYRLTRRGNEEVAIADGAVEWRWRVAPLEPGEHRWTLIARAGVEEARLSGTFVAGAASRPGYVRISPRNPRYFEFSDGTSYYPIGHNLRSPSDSRPDFYTTAQLRDLRRAERDGVFAYESWMHKMADHGENFTRIWMCPWWAGLEWNADYPGFHGLAYYNQANAARLDYLIDLAEDLGIYVNLETMNHGALSTRIDGDWTDNPLCSKQPGGFLRYATDFFTSERAIDLHRRKLRYTVARWGYSPAIAIWGVITESEWVEPYDRGIELWKPPTGQYIPSPYATPRYQDLMRHWLVATSDYLAATDSHPHVVTTHFSNPQHGVEMWKQPAMQVVHNNAYTFFASIKWQPEILDKDSGVADVIVAYDRFFARFANKPAIVGEWGGHPWKNNDQHLVQELHTGLWASYMTTLAGATGYWWWNLLDSEDRYSDFAALAAYAAGEDRRDRDLRPGRPTLLRGNGWRAYGVDALGLTDANGAFAYLYDRSINNFSESLRARGFDDPRFIVKRDHLLQLPATIKPGPWRVEFWNPWTGEIVAAHDVDLPADRRLPLPPFRVDLALKLKPRG